MSEGEEIIAKVYCQWLDLKHLYEVKENILLFFTALVNSKDNADCERRSVNVRSITSPLKSTGFLWKIKAEGGYTERNRAVISS